MSVFLVQSTPADVIFYLENEASSGPSTAPEIAAYGFDVLSVALKKSTDAFFKTQAFTLSANASATIGELTINVPGVAGNSYTFEIVAPGGTSGLSATLTGTALVVSLSVSAGAPVAADNTNAQIVTAINGLLSEVVGEFFGLGTNIVSAAAGPTSLSGGTDGDFTNLGGGFFSLQLDAVDTAVLGSLAIRITGEYTKPALIQANVVAAFTEGSSSAALPIPTTAIFGYVAGPQGAPVVGAKVGFKTLAAPVVRRAADSGLVITNEYISTSTDAQGFFTINLIAGTAMSVSIPAANYSRTFVVPSLSSNLFDIP